MGSLSPWLCLFHSLVFYKTYKIFSRSAAWHYVACKILERLNLLRVDKNLELEGLDPTVCGGHAFFYEPVRELEMKEHFSF